MEVEPELDERGEIPDPDWGLRTVGAEMDRLGVETCGLVEFRVERVWNPPDRVCTPTVGEVDLDGVETPGRGAGVGLGAGVGVVVVLAGLVSGVTLGREDLTVGLVALT
mgnify:CR=1 FL=1